MPAHSVTDYRTDGLKVGTFYVEQFQWRLRDMSNELIARQQLAVKYARVYCLLWVLLFSLFSCFTVWFALSIITGRWFLAVILTLEWCFACRIVLLRLFRKDKNLAVVDMMALDKVVIASMFECSIVEKLHIDRFLNRHHYTATHFVLSRVVSKEERSHLGLEQFTAATTIALVELWFIGYRSRFPAY